jgi:hypothetical protein
VLGGSGARWNGAVISRGGFDGAWLLLGGSPYYESALLRCEMVVFAVAMYYST